MMNISIEGKERRFWVIEKQCVKLRMSLYTNATIFEQITALNSTPKVPFSGNVDGFYEWVFFHIFPIHFFF